MMKLGGGRNQSRPAAEKILINDENPGRFSGQAVYYKGHRPAGRHKKRAAGQPGFFGAGDGNRTHLWSLGSSRSTNELRPPV